MAGSPWQAEMAVVTPESVSFSYQVAGIGSRFLALLVDHLIEGCFVFAAAIAADLSGLESSVWLARLLVTGGFLFFYLGYFVFFEILWDGQTPGKRLLHLRVVRDGGYGLTAPASLLRNLLRVMDFLPFAYGFGLLSMFLSDKSRRLGDFVAGTVVIRDQRTTVPPRLRLAHGSVLASLGVEAQILVRGRLNLFSPEELRVMREFIRRRAGLAADARGRLATKLRAVVLAHLPELADLARGAPSERLIEAVVAAYEEELT